MATPPLDDPNFDRTVVFMLEHTAAGAVGVVLNRPHHDMAAVIELLGSGVLSTWHSYLAPPAALFAGGPVGQDSLIGLARGRGRDDATWGSVAPRLGTVDLSLPPDEATTQLDCVPIFRGYAGWGPGQLDAELDADVWMVFDATDDDLFTDEPDRLWRAVVRRQGGHLSWIADAPDDLSAN